MLKFFGTVFFYVPFLVQYCGFFIFVPQIFGFHIRPAKFLREIIIRNLLPIYKCEGIFPI